MQKISPIHQVILETQQILEYRNPIDSAQFLSPPFKIINVTFDFPELLLSYTVFE